MVQDQSKGAGGKVSRLCGAVRVKAFKRRWIVAGAKMSFGVRV